MSRKFDTDLGMPFKEKSIWIQLLVGIGVYSTYLATVLFRASGPVPLHAVAYERLLITAFAAGLVLTIVAHIAVGIVTKDCGKQDERDAYIDRCGEAVRAPLQCLTMLVPLGLTLAGFEHFWIANAIYLSLFVTDLIAQATKLVGYRRGLCG